MTSHSGDAREFLRYEYALVVAAEPEPISTGLGASGLELAVFRCLEFDAAVIDRVEYHREESGRMARGLCQIATFDKVFGFWTSVSHCTRAERSLIVQTVDLLHEHGTIEYPSHFDPRAAVNLLQTMVDSFREKPTIVALS